MQTLIQAFCKGKLTSLRQTIANDKELGDFGFSIAEEKNNKRAGGWLKLKGDGVDGVLNIEWEASTKILSARIVNRKKGKPDLIAGNFVSYLLGRHSKRIKAIHIVAID